MSFEIKFLVFRWCVSVRVFHVFIRVYVETECIS